MGRGVEAALRPSPSQGFAEPLNRPLDLYTVVGGHEILVTAETENLAEHTTGSMPSPSLVRATAHPREAQLCMARKEHAAAVLFH